MNLKASFKKKCGLIFSILLHLLLIICAIHTLDQDRYRPTSTKGYQVELVHVQDNSQLPPAAANANLAKQNTLAVSQSKAEINLEKAAQKKKSQELIAAKHRLERQRHKQELQELHASQEGVRQQELQRQGVAMTNKNQEQIIASAPTGGTTTVGEGAVRDSSTDGDGSQDGAFDFRVIEYGRDAADVIKQNIVVPQAYQYTHITYRAFVVLDRNMQFQSMQMVKSTGNVEYDANIAKALRQTIYPPLPPGADWHEFHNIDFTIK